jgi:hypothetical protein
VVNLCSTALNILALCVYKQTYAVCKCRVGNLDVLDGSTIVVDIGNTITTDILKDTVVGYEVLNNVGAADTKHTTLVANVT